MSRTSFIKAFASALMLLVGVFSTAADNYVPCRGDLLFVVAGEGEMSGAIADATRIDSIAFDHVAMLTLNPDGTPVVIEAAPHHGARVTDFKQFVGQAAEGIVVMRVTLDFDSASAIARAWSHIGEEYDWWYMPNNGKMYCSELIAECYLLDNGERIFPASPMTFNDANGRTPAFWVELFRRLEAEIPEGVPGTNPTTLSRSPWLTFVTTISKKSLADMP